MKKQEKRAKAAKPSAKQAEVTKPKPAAKPAKAETKAKKPGVRHKLARPFVRFGNYIAASFRELRLMRFPNRKAAWKMTLAVVLYALIFFIFIALLDAFWSMVFQRILG